VGPRNFVENLLRGLLFEGCPGEANESVVLFFPLWQVLVLRVTRVA